MDTLSLRLAARMDIRTLLICFLAVLTLQVLALFLAHRSRRATDGTGWMAASFGAMALASGFIVLRHLAPDFLTIIVSNSLFTLGFVLMHRAVAEFIGLGRRQSGLHLTVFGAVVFGMTYFTYGVYDTPARIVIVSVAFTIEASLIALLLVRSNSATRVEERFLGAAFGVMAVANALRAGLTLRYGSTADFMRSDLIQTVSFLTFIVVCASIGFFFVWMSSARRHLALHRQATRDPLTGLLNRRGFLAVAPTRMRAAEREGHDILLLYADIDGLKRVNDTLGHDAGDRAIREAAGVLREVLRASDSVARLGGDEFCALLPVQSLDDSARILERIEDQIRTQNAHPGRDYVLAISAATAPVHRQEERPLAELLRDADQGMYAAKRRRKRDAAGVV